MLHSLWESSSKLIFIGIPYGSITLKFSSTKSTIIFEWSMTIDISCVDPLALVSAFIEITFIRYFLCFQFSLSMKFIILKISFVHTAISFFQGSFTNFFPILYTSFINCTVFEGYSSFEEFPILEWSFLSELWCFKKTWSIIKTIFQIPFIVVAIIINDFPLNAISVFEYAF